MWRRRSSKMGLLAVSALLSVVLVLISNSKVNGSLGHLFCCVQYGAGFGLKHLWNESTSSRTNLWSIGAREFDAVWASSWAGFYEWQEFVKSARGINANILKVRSFDLVRAIYSSMISKDKQKRAWYDDMNCLTEKGGWEFNYCEPGEKGIVGKDKDHDLWCMQSNSFKFKPCVSETEELALRMYLVKQNGRVLKGWIHVEIEMMDKSDEIEALYFQMREDYYNGIGDFVHESKYPGAKCKPSKSYLSTPTQFQLYPCGLTGNRETLITQGIMMARKDTYINPKLVEGKLHEKEISRGIHFLLKMDEYWCNKHTRIIPMVFVLTRKNRERWEKNPFDKTALVWRKASDYWVYPNWYGAADVILPKGDLDCSEKLIDGVTGDITKAAKDSWIEDQRVLLSARKDIWDYHDFCGRHAEEAYNEPTFGGRCRDINTHWGECVLSTYPHQCIPTSTTASQSYIAKKNLTTKFENITTTTTTTTNTQVGASYLDRLTITRNMTCEAYAECPQLPSTQADYDLMIRYPATQKRTNSAIIEGPPIIVAGVNDSRTLVRIYKEKSARRFHGVTSIVITFLITPVSIFTARYYKETFMRRRCFGIHVWYWFHMTGIFGTFVMFLSGEAAISPFLAVWGKSKHLPAIRHRVLGFASIGTFVFLVVTGGYRFKAPGIGRLICMTVHALVGFTHHWLNFLSMLSSTYVPNSPSLDNCDDVYGMPYGYSLVFWVTFGFYFAETILHILITVIHVIGDCRSGACHRWYFPIIPIVRNDQMADLESNPIVLRKVLFYVHLAICMAACAGCSYLVLSNDVPSHCQTGETTCEYDFGCSKLSQRYHKWYHHQT